MAETVRRTKPRRIGAPLPASLLLVQEPAEDLRCPDFPETGVVTRFNRPLSGGRFLFSEGEREFQEFGMEIARTREAFNSVAPKVDFAAQEEQTIEFWRRISLLERTQSERLDGKDFTFFEGPPTANGPPGIHHVLARAFKDMFPRYRTMRGYKVLRKGGWDTHGLPVEIEVEKNLGLGGKREIEEYGIKQFNQLCRDSVSEYIGEWEALTERMGYLVDTEDPYVTYHNGYVESLWWILKQLWNRDLLRQGFKSVPFCPRCGTPLSSHELSLGYKENTEDPSIFVKFKVVDEEDTYFLAWTTTPWTLPGNAALAVGEQVEYVAARVETGDTLYLAAELAEAVLEPGFEILSRCKGADLVGWRYLPLYEFLPVKEPHAVVLPADFVSTVEGTGIVHVAPAFGADDLDLGQRVGLPIIQTVRPDGTFRPEVTPWAGMFVKDADPEIQADLVNRGLMYKSTTCLHTYPFCWRCDSPLLYYAKETWFIRTSECKERLMDLNQTINWIPGHIKDGRFGQWLSNNVDWALGRDRFWGTPLPIWESDAPGSDFRICIGSVAELEEHSGQDLSELDLHRPYVDEITWKAPDGGIMRRVPEVADCWFDSGAMPVAQWHYPKKGKEEFHSYKQADFICEAIDQTRGWFYTLHALSALLFDRPAFLNVVCLGHILAEDGHKMSKSLGNVINPWMVMQQYGADATRWTMYAAAQPGDSRRFSNNLVEESVRKFLNRLWSSYSFHVTYALAADWYPAEGRTSPVHLLDRWVLSELQVLVQRVTEAYESYDATGCTRPVVRFVERLSNWYVRLNRRRFWNGEPEALQTLHEVLTTLAHLVAPAAPFVSEAIYQNLVARPSGNSRASVHLSTWPQFNGQLVDLQLNAHMELVQRVTSLGHAARQAAALKVRQPLNEVIVQLLEASEQAVLPMYQDLVCQELNVRKLTLSTGRNLMKLEVFPLPRQLGQKFGPGYPKIRAELAKLEQAQLAAELQSQGQVTVTAGAEVFVVNSEDVEIRKTPLAGFSVSESQGTSVAIATEVSAELLLEGQVRDMVRQVQNARKDLGLDISDRIVLTFLTESELVRRAMAQHGSYLQEETLTVELDWDIRETESTDPAPNQVDLQVSGETVRIQIVKIEKS